jgi:flavorubredoxin/flavin reductase (DIM6/NTAB) family NADH-FMN oxidoreductase RutF
MLKQELGECQQSQLVEGVTKLAFIVPSKATGSKEEFMLGKGTTENVYILHEKDGGVDAGPLTLIDVPAARFMDAFMEQMSPYLSRVEGVVLTHVSEDDYEVLIKLAEEVERTGSAKPKVYLSEAAKSILLNYMGAAAEKIDIEVIDDDSFVPCRGNGRLDAVCTSTGKYPDLMNVFDENTSILFSGKFFAAHTTSHDSENPSWKDAAEDWHHYFDCNFFTESAQEGVRRIFQITADNADDGIGLKNPDVERLAPYHGPVVRSQSWKLMAKYEAWLERKMAVVNEGNVVVLYATAYSNTFKMAEAIAAGLESSGINVELMNVEFTDAADIRKAVEQCDGFAVGSPTLGGQMPIQVKEALGIILKSAQGGSQQAGGDSMKAGSIGSKPCGAFGSFGWSGEAPEEANQRLKDAGFNISFDPIRCKFTPTPEMLAQCNAAGARLAQSITKAKDEQMKALQAAEAQAGASRLEAKSEEEMASEARMLNAFGRIINSSCMLTFQPAEEGKEGVRVPVSWVSQASFTPPGLMIAVEKKGLDAWLSTSVEEQLDQLFLKYDADGSGELDYEELDPMLTEMFGAEIGSAQEDLLKQKKEEAIKIIDADGGGSVDKEEFIAAATEGPFADMLARERRMASLESLLGEGDGGLQFTLNMLPEGMNESEAMEAGQDKKFQKKAKNGCTVISGSTSFVECEVKSLVSAGTSSIIYATVKQGEVMDENNRTGLLKADHAAIDYDAQNSASAAEKELVDA